MTVNLNGHTSRLVSINADGSHISLFKSTFFLIFINDFPGCISSHLGLFSGDTTVSYSVNSKTDWFDEVILAIDRKMAYRLLLIGTEIWFINLNSSKMKFLSVV